jgi:two-component system, response regulator YesN
MKGEIKLYNLLIVDDEEIAVNGLAYDVDWGDLNISEIFKAYDADEAMQCLENRKIDVVITDIRMPGISGLEMTELIRDKWPYAKIILISGYDEFEYAQRAVNIGAFAYITKPALYEEVKDMVKRALNEIKMQMEERKTVENARRQLESMLPILRERYLSDWVVTGRINPQNQTDELKSYMIELDDKSPIALVLFRIDEWKEQTSIDKLTYQIAVRDIVNNVLLKGHKGMYFRDYEDNQVLILQKEDKEELNKLLKYMEGMAENFQDALNRSFGCVISVIWSEIASLEHIAECYQRTLEKAHRSSIWGPGIILGTNSQVNDGDTEVIMMDKHQSSLLILLESLKKDEAVKYVCDYFKEFEPKLPIAYENLLEIYYMVSNTLLQASIKRGIPIRNWAGDEEKYFYNFERLKSIQQLKEWCIRCIRKYIEYNIVEEVGHTSQIVNKAKKIIEDYYCTEITLTEISSYVYVHPNYLSRVFKKEEGISVMEYIIQLRMEKAKDLLKRSETKVYEISEKLGYSSTAHFNRIFKRYTGVTPKEYQLIASERRK